MNADGMVKYYEPLYEWLKDENARLGLKSGWDSSKTEYYPFDEKMDFIGVCANEKESNEHFSAELFLRHLIQP